jgi:hypothetical protein
LASQIASYTAIEAATAEERGLERLGVRLADVEADCPAAPGLGAAFATPRHSRTTFAPSRTFSTFASSH